MTVPETPNGQPGHVNGSQKVTICVFCGSSPGTSPAHMEAARALGREIAARDIKLVYGGGSVGLMGEVAKTVCGLKGPDYVHGVIPEALVKYERDGTYKTTNKSNYVVPTVDEYGHTTVIPDMHTRKKIMAEEVFQGALGSGFVGLPGGYGTMEELFEVITWNQLGIHKTGICLFNVEGYWDGIIQWRKTAVEQGFVKGPNKDIVVTGNNAQACVDALRDYQVSEATFNLTWGSQ